MGGGWALTGDSERDDLEGRELDGGDLRVVVDLCDGVRGMAFEEVDGADVGDWEIPAEGAGGAAALGLVEPEDEV